LSLPALLKYAPPEISELKHKNQGAAISSSPGMSKEKTTEN
jgi:hypothetical protein